MVPGAPRQGGAESRGNRAANGGGGGIVGVTAAARAHAHTLAQPRRPYHTREAGGAGPRLLGFAARGRRRSPSSLLAGPATISQTALLSVLEQLSI